MGTRTYYPGLHVVEKFPDVFPHELPGLPPDREIEFCIDLIPRAQLISIPPYQMAKSTELRSSLMSSWKNSSSRAVPHLGSSCPIFKES